MLSVYRCVDKSIDAAFNSGLDDTMKTKALLVILTLGLATAAACLAADPKIEEALRDLDEQWSKAAGTKDVDKTVSFYSDDAVVMPPNAPRATTKEAMRAIWKDLLTDASISWKTKEVEVAQSGDIGYTSGTYEVTMTDPTGTPVNDRGKYLEVWKKQADGTWKCVIDMWNSDLRVASSAASEKK
jgi:ketosteroid isomerase-like protein